MNARTPRPALLLLYPAFFILVLLAVAMGVQAQAIHGCGGRCQRTYAEDVTEANVDFMDKSLEVGEDYAGDVRGSMGEYQNEQESTEIKNSDSQRQALEDYNQKQDSIEKKNSDRQQAALQQFNRDMGAASEAYDACRMQSPAPPPGTCETGYVQAMQVAQARYEQERDAAMNDRRAESAQNLAEYEARRDGALAERNQESEANQNRLNDGIDQAKRDRDQEDQRNQVDWQDKLDGAEKRYEECAGPPPS